MKQSHTDSKRMKQTTRIVEMDILRSILGKIWMDRFAKPESATAMQYHRHSQWTSQVYKKAKKKVWNNHVSQAEKQG